MLLGMQKDKKSKEGEKAGKQMLESLLSWRKRSMRNDSCFCLLGKKKSYGFFEKKRYAILSFYAAFSFRNTITFFQSYNG